MNDLTDGLEVENFVFLKSKDPNKPSIYVDYALHFTKMLLSDTYDKKGRLQVPSSVGDCYQILTEKAAGLINLLIEVVLEKDHPKIKKGDWVYACDDKPLFDLITSELEFHLDDTCVSKTFDVCTAYNYWDGSKHCSIVIDSDNEEYPPEWELCSPEESQEYFHIMADSQELKTMKWLTFFQPSDKNILLTKSSSPSSWEYLTILLLEK